jgi:hypothetical protein
MDNIRQRATSHNEAVELVLLCQKYASKGVLRSCFMTLNGGINYEGKYAYKKRRDECFN